jgi:hypothetical protein
MARLLWKKGWRGRDAEGRGWSAGGHLRPLMAAVSFHGINGEEWGRGKGFGHFRCRGGGRARSAGLGGRAQGVGRRLRPVWCAARRPARACAGEMAPAGGPARQGERGGRAAWRRLLGEQGREGEGREWLNGPLMGRD